MCKCFGCRRTPVFFRLRWSYNSIMAELILSSETLREKSDGSLAVECSFLATSARTGSWSTNSFHWEQDSPGASEYWSQNTSQTVTVQSFVFQLPGCEHTLALFTRSDEIHHIVMTSTPAAGSDGPPAYKHVLKNVACLRVQQSLCQLLDCR